MHSSDIDKSYVSPYDIFLAKFDATHAKTPSQQIEINKHSRLAKLRDDSHVAQKLEGSANLWE